MTKKMVYVLEDDPDISELIAYILSEAGYEVKESKTVNRLAEQLRHGVPDVFILDVFLPDGNGLDVCRQLRESEATALTPIIIMSAHQSKQAVESDGLASEFISKPFDIDYFRKRVDKFTS